MRLAHVFERFEQKEAQLDIRFKVRFDKPVDVFEKLHGNKKTLDPGLYGIKLELQKVNEGEEVLTLQARFLHDEEVMGTVAASSLIFKLRKNNIVHLEEGSLPHISKAVNDILRREDVVGKPSTKKK